MEALRGVIAVVVAFWRAAFLAATACATVGALAVAFAAARAVTRAARRVVMVPVVVVTGGRTTVPTIVVMGDMRAVVKRFGIPVAIPVAPRRTRMVLRCVRIVLLGALVVAPAVAS